MRAFWLALLLVLPLASAAVPTPVRCNQAYCFSLFDEDADGVPDGGAGGTSTILHEAPTVSFAVSPRGGFVAFEGLVGDEYDDDTWFVGAYAGVDRNGMNLTSVFTEFVIVPLAQGAAPLLLIQASGADTDGDGRMDRFATVPSLPIP